MVEIRDIGGADLVELLSMNNAAVPNVDAHELDTFTARTALSQVNLVAAQGESLLGFLLAARSGGDFPSENYRWFGPRYADFLYVDRIVVAEHARGRGIGESLYGALFERTAADGVARVACEVNLLPPNPGSLRFHHRLGFAEVGQQRTEGGTKLVSMLTRDTPWGTRQGNGEAR